MVINHLIEIRLASPMQPGNPLGNQYCVSLHLGSKFEVIRAPAYLRKLSDLHDDQRHG
jgi:hypothetical protein